MLKKFLAIFTFFAVILTCTFTYADLAPVPPKPIKRNSFEHPVVKVKTVNVKNQKITLEITMQSSKIKNYNYEIIKSSDYAEVTKGTDSFNSVGKSFITFDYADLKNENPENLFLELETYSKTISTKYGQKKYKDILTEIYDYVIFFNPVILFNGIFK